MTTVRSSHVRQSTAESFDPTSNLNFDVGYCMARNVALQLNDRSLSLVNPQHDFEKYHPQYEPTGIFTVH